MARFATAGSRLYIGGPVAVPADDMDEDDFDGQTWTEVGELVNLGTVGDVSNEVTEEIINRARTAKAKGTRNSGTMEVTANIDYSDPGQVALIAAEKTPHDYAFRLVFNDAPPDGTPSERLFAAKVMSAAEALNGANNFAQLTASLGINSNIVRIDAAEAV